MELSSLYTMKVFHKGKRPSVFQIIFIIIIILGFKLQQRPALERGTNTHAFCQAKPIFLRWPLTPAEPEVTWTFHLFLKWRLQLLHRLTCNKECCVFWLNSLVLARGQEASVAKSAFASAELFRGWQRSPAEDSYTNWASRYVLPVEANCAETSQTEAGQCKRFWHLIRSHLHAVHLSDLMSLLFCFTKNWIQPPFHDAVLQWK